MSADQFLLSKKAVTMNTMKHFLAYHRVLAWLVCASLTLCAFAGQAVEIKLKDGSRWRGEVNDVVELRYMQNSVEVPLQGTLLKVEPLYVVVDGNVAGVRKQVTIFRSDIVTMKTIGKSDGSADSATPSPNSDTKSSQATGSAVGNSSKPANASQHKPGVIVLPMSGMVGVEFRHQEIVAVGKEADKYGPGQIIVLLIDSGGGTVEMEAIHKSICEIKKRHRVVAWIKKAISAAAASASACDEIYFMTEGTFGAMTGYAGDTALQGQELKAWLETAGKWFEAGGRSKYIAWAMIEHTHMLSYDKDPVTGEVTFYPDKSGAVVLSDEKSNLVFTASTALDCGFSDGTADTPEDLAKLLNLPEWYEITDYGRRISADWHRTCEEAQQRIRILSAQMDYKNIAGGNLAKIGTEISILNELIRWWDRCPNVAQMMLPPKNVLERAVEERRKAIADSRRR